GAASPSSTTSDACRNECRIPCIGSPIRACQNGVRVAKPLHPSLALFRTSPVLQVTGESIFLLGQHKRHKTLSFCGPADEALLFPPAPEAWTMPAAPTDVGRSSGRYRHISDRARSHGHCATQHRNRPARSAFRAPPRLARQCL